MIYALAFMTCGLMWYFRLQRNEVLFLQYRYRFFALRDRLREKAIAKEVDCDHWMFDFYDNSLCGIVDSLPRINIYYTIALFLLHRKQGKFLKFRAKLSEGLKEDPEFKEIDDEFTALLNGFMESRHVFFFGFLKLGVISVVTPYLIFQQVKSTVSQSTSELRMYPETSSACLT